MNKSTLERLAPLSGIASVVLMLAGAAVAGSFMYLPPAEVAQRYFTDGSASIFAGGYLGLLSMFFLIWFAGSLWEHLRRHDQGSGRISALALAGGVVGGLSLGLGFAMMITAAERAGTSGGLDAVAAVTLYDLFGTSSGVAGIGFAAMILSTAVAALRHHAFPSWFGWVSALLAILLLSPGSYIGMYLAPIWLAVVSVWIFVRGRSAG